MGAGEIMRLLGVSKQYANTLAHSKGFPEPADTVGGRDVWLAEDVEEWAERTGRAMPGRITES